MKERRSNRRFGGDWKALNELVDIKAIPTIESIDDIPGSVEFIKETSFSIDEQHHFLSQNRIPIKIGDKKGFILSFLFGRVPSFLQEEYTDMLFLAPPELCSLLLANEFMTPTQSKISQAAKPLDYIEAILRKTEELGASDLTISWRDKNISLMYSAGDNNMKVEEDIINDLAYGEKIRVALINLAYERPSESIVDGKFNLTHFGEQKEYRLSVLPTVAGYSIVIRSSQKFDKEMTLGKLGYMDKPQSIIENILSENVHGLFLLTGPTGSGKTTTIYTLLQQMNSERYLKIKTAEDPVEIQLDGIDQCQVNNHGLDEHKITYSRLLKGFMRQKPDVIVVGEIRDKDVATNAIEASLTGHMVISTLHTGGVEPTFSRLRTALNVGDDNIEDALIGVLNQRLVKKLCSCKISSGKHFKRNEEGCSKCQKLGTIGYNKEIVACEIAALHRGEKNYLKENYKEYYSYLDCAKDLYDFGEIDLETSKLIKKFSN